MHSTLTRHRRLTALALLLAATVAGIAWRKLPLHLPWFAFKYGGSMLWAAAVYWLAAALLPRASTRRLTIVAAITAVLVEYSRRIHIFPALDAFRLTLPGKLLLGRFFSHKNILAYWAAICLTAFFDDRFLPQNKAEEPAPKADPSAPSSTRTPIR